MPLLLALQIATSLPGDHAPLPLSVMLAPPHAPAPPFRADTTPAPSAVAAEKAVHAAVARCLARGVRLSVALVDADGVLRAASSADGAMPGGVFVAARKAAAAAAFAASTSTVQARLRVDPRQPALKPYMAVSPGAVPIRAGGRLLGAIGASGGSGPQDEACAAHGAAMAETMR